MQALRILFGVKSILLRLAAIIGLLVFGNMFFSSYRAVEDAKNPTTLSLREVMATSPEQLPKYFILKGAVRKSFATVSSSLQFGKRTPKTIHRDIIYPVYPFAAQDSAVIETPREAAVVFIEEASGKDTTEINLADFGQSLTMKVENNELGILSDAKALFEEQGVIVSPKAFKLKRGYDIPGTNQLWYALICLVLALLVARSIFFSLKELGKPMEKPKPVPVYPRNQAH